MLQFGHKIAAILPSCFAGLMFFQGTLGTGKTTLCRAIIQACGWQGRVKSPTYTLVESYEVPLGKIHHFDLYRLTSPDELEYLGIEDYLDGQCLSLIEWPENGQGWLPAPDLTIKLTEEKSGRTIEVIAHSTTGNQWIRSWQ